MLPSYLRRHYKIIIMLGLFAAVFAAVFSLYDLPLEAVLYAALLCAAVGTALFFIGYARYVRQHRALGALLKVVSVSLDGLPEPEGAIERDYQDLLRAVWADKLRAAAKAEADRRSLTEYYTLWAHQVKTPIAAMRLLLQESGRDNTELAAELFRIEQYVDMVLSYLRLDSETTDYVLRKCSLDDIVRGCVRKYARLFIIRKISLSFTETGMSVLTDEKWLSFVIEQLLSNALKYTPEGGRIAVCAEGGVLAIADTGIGIRAEDLPRVFEKGFTGYNGREEKKSTGIGLYLCRRVCDRLGHRIGIASKVGAGTKVTIDLSSAEALME